MKIEGEHRGRFFVFACEHKESSPVQTPRVPLVKWCLWVLGIGLR